MPEWKGFSFDRRADAPLVRRAVEIYLIDQTWRNRQQSLAWFGFSECSPQGEKIIPRSLHLYVREGMVHFEALLPHLQNCPGLAQTNRSLLISAMPHLSILNASMHVPIIHYKYFPTEPEGTETELTRRQSAEKHSDRDNRIRLQQLSTRVGQMDKSAYSLATLQRLFPQFIVTPLSEQTVLEIPSSKKF